MVLMVLFSNDIKSVPNCSTEASSTAAAVKRDFPFFSITL